jgi:hypothetical protein
MLILMKSNGSTYYKLDIDINTGILSGVFSKGSILSSAVRYLCDIINDKNIYLSGIS